MQNIAMNLVTSYSKLSGISAGQCVMSFTLSLEYRQSPLLQVVRFLERVHKVKFCEVNSNFP
jgi:hypothetical protein